MAVGSKDREVAERGKPSAERRQGGNVARPRPGMADFLAGESKSFVSDLLPYLPQELIGGVIPHLPGTEDEAVWNAASQACSTEKVHFCYSVEGGRLWYLACPSSSMASNPDSWCPLAAALPGKSEFWDKETVYLYEQEGLASALEKIGRYGSATKIQNASTAHMFFANPLKAKSLMRIFSTHPPIEDRVAKLRGMSLNG